MVAVYLLGSVFAGLIAFFTALYLGASFWRGLLSYTLAGGAMMLYMPVTHVILAAITRRKPAAAETIPQGTAVAADKSPPVEVAPSPAPTMRILAVDDDPFILDLVPTIAANFGYPEVTAVASAAEALAVLDGDARGFDCLLLDINMPQMNGIELCRAARALPGYAATPIIMLTGKRDLESMGDALQAGATDYATKPFDIDMLGMRLKAAEEAINSSKYAASAAGVIPTALALGDGMRLSGVSNLVGETVLATFLTELPISKTADVALYAVHLHERDTLRDSLSRAQIESLFRRMAETAAARFGDDLALMSFTDADDLLILVSADTPLSLRDLETDLQGCLDRAAQDAGIATEAASMLSVAGPVAPEGSRESRARLTVTRAVSLAQNRAWNRRFQKVVGLFD